jgi:hypothetical protein
VTDTDRAYFIFRFGLSVVHALVWFWVLRLSVPLARRAANPDQRLFIVSVVFVIALVSLLLALSAAWALVAPLPTDPVRAMFGTTLAALLTIAGSVIIWKWPWRSSK